MGPQDSPPPRPSPPIDLMRYFSEESRPLRETVSVMAHYAGLAEESGAVAHEAYDILAEVVVAATGAQSTFDPSLQTRPWLLGIAAIIIKQRQRDMMDLSRQAPSPADLARMDDAALGEAILEFILASAGATPSPAAPHDLLTPVAFERLVARLEPERREFLSLAIKVDLDYALLGYVYDVIPGAVRLRLYRIVDHLSRMARGE